VRVVRCKATYSRELLLHVIDNFFFTGKLVTVRSLISRVRNNYFSTIIL